MTEKPFSIVGLQTDDTLILADTSFIEKEEEALQEAHFLSKPRETLSTNQPLKFNGGWIRLEDDNSLTLTQEHQCANLEPMNQKHTDLRSSCGDI